MIKIQGYTATELERFRHYQRQTYEILEAAANTLQLGMTENQATHALRKAFHLAGAHNYFHVPVALFGERTAYPGDFGGFEALSTDNRLLAGDVVILDAAPIFEGYTVDASLAWNWGGNDTFDSLDAELPTLRHLIHDRINDGASFQAIAFEVDDRIRELGFENCHRKHIGAVLGHRVTRADSARLSSWSYKGLAVKQVAWFLTKSRLAGKRFGTVTPNWNHSNACKDIAPHGLWAVEPHLAAKGVGVKFEELLLIDDNGAQWLDDDLPHHRRWATA